jgi:NAD(P)-dependent dehydrogenase (short-subunit alcohol dehydrogenase family)
MTPQDPYQSQHLYQSLVPYDFAGQIALVTGGGVGIGRIISHYLAAAGAHVFVLGRRPDAVSRTVEEITTAGGSAQPVVADLGDPADVTAAFAEVDAREARLDILINNAGIAGPTSALSDIVLADWERTLAVNLTGVMMCCQLAIRRMRVRRAGKIVNIGSGSGKRPLINRAAYTTSKLGLVGLTRTMAQEVGTDGITVNAISPYLVEGDRLNRVVSSMAAARGVTEEEQYKDLVKDSALGRGVTAEEVAEVALFLCSPGAASLTGQDLNVSAGAVMY